MNQLQVSNQNQVGFTQEQIEVIQNSGCWIWPRAKQGQGYGFIKIGGKQHYAHRVSYQLFRGRIPQNKFVCHRCDNPSCFNPAHLFVGTHAENMADMRAKGRAPKRAYVYKKFSDETVAAMRAEYAAGAKQPELQKKYNISESQLWKILARKVRT
jgi:hypothetical protein